MIKISLTFQMLFFTIWIPVTMTKIFIKNQNLSTIFHVNNEHWIKKDLPERYFN